ncbi:hypothetical protein XylorDRAFT_0197 [Xylanibacter oryzae DSM 17970]|uniref:Uncharacterized protein n=1 Tax=Xylanibacter oryzae DSM 17970 TaxID=915438 RepID=A0ABP3BCG4_9BACT|nr:hypothetical protein XylorDRAFT_0197 [Xylanibacter oryzae DSM 17970]
MSANNCTLFFTLKIKLSIKIITFVPLLSFNSDEIQQQHTKVKDFAAKNFSISDKCDDTDEYEETSSL